MNAKQRRAWNRAIRRAMDGWYEGLADEEIRLAPRFRRSSAFWDEVSRSQCAGDEMGHYDNEIEDEEPCWECHGDGYLECPYCGDNGYHCDECDDGTVTCTTCGGVG